MTTAVSISATAPGPVLEEIVELDYEAAMGLAPSPATAAPSVSVFDIFVPPATRKAVMARLHELSCAVQNADRDVYKALNRRLSTALAYVAERDHAVKLGVEWPYTDVDGVADREARRDSEAT